MKPSRLTSSCLASATTRPVASSSPVSFALLQPLLPFLYPPPIRRYASLESTNRPHNKSVSDDPWCFLLGQPDPNSAPPPIFNHFRSPQSSRSSTLPYQHTPAYSAYFPSPLSHYQERSRTNLSAGGSGAFPYGPHTSRNIDPTYSTITERERAIFTTIFESILSESPTNSTGVGGSGSGLGGKFSPRAPTPALTALFESAVGPQLRHGELSFGPSNPQKARNISAAMARASAISDYPPSLRLAAAQVAGLARVPLTESEEKEEAQRQTELVRTISQMDSCETDLQLLEFLEENVFTMVIPGSPHSDSLEIKGRSYTFPSASYADLLSHSLKLLMRVFKDLPSTLAIFHRIKSLGPESYVVGCSIIVYNLILEAKWEAYRDIRVIEETLDEMQVNGIEGNEETIEVLRAICKDADKLGGITFVEENRQNRFSEVEREILGKVEIRMKGFARAIKDREMTQERERLRAERGFLGSSTTTGIRLPPPLPPVSHKGFSRKIKPRLAALTL